MLLHRACAYREIRKRDKGQKVKFLFSFLFFIFFCCCYYCLLFAASLLSCHTTYLSSYKYKQPNHILFIHQKKRREQRVYNTTINLEINICIYIYLYILFLFYFIISAIVFLTNKHYRHELEPSFTTSSETKTSCRRIFTSQKSNGRKRGKKKKRSKKEDRKNKMICMLMKRYIIILLLLLLSVAE